MRPVSPAALAWLRQTLIPEISAPLRTRPRPSRCHFCAAQPVRSRLQTRHLQSSTAKPTSQPQQQQQERQQPPEQRHSREDPQTKQTYYNFFPVSLPQGAPPKGPFTIDLTALRKEFLQLQSRAHPDLHTAENKNKAQALSARINEAYKTLQSPLLRAQYLLSLRGIDVGADETAKVEDTELLMEVLEAREAIEEAEEEGDLKGLREENDERIAESVRVLENAFARNDLETAKKEAVRLRYWVNIGESIHGWEKGKPVVLQH